MSHVGLRNTLCHVNYCFSHVVRLHVDFKKWPYHSVEIRGHEPPPPPPQLSQ